ncbi:MULTISPECIES: cyclophane-forming radical SAM/SPASM peptide maturase XyeB [Providencia]|uniref:cyclophane-forming radical SAM/SPASM peptide maturase XyeB n=1 Tax=Providencia TaxID=586 RepID=UPI00234B04C8|nr:cyclophane-forming radical SAM/SPASM peptide maturase XyeB [Providencia sp. PROV036]
MDKIKHLEVILKVSERCNINCTYCYVFNLGNEVAINSKPIISSEIINHLVEFFEQATTEYDIESIQVDFHGGEPLMMGKKRFIAACQKLISGNYSNTKLYLACQTNAILIDPDWIDIFSKYSISIGVSIDGPKHINDKHRLDTKGRSTYDNTIKGFKLLQNYWKEGKLKDQPGILCVANPNVSGKDIYRHFVDELECTKFDFLIPDETHDTCIDPTNLSEFYCSAIDEFFLDSNNDIYIRYFHTSIQSMLKPDFTPTMGVSKTSNDIIALTISSEGDVYIDDTLRGTNDNIFSVIGNIKNIKFRETLSSWQMKKYMQINSQLPSDCVNCIWKKTCSGGRHIQRYSKADSFNRKSVFCPSIKKILSRAASHLLESGVPEELIMDNLGIKS